jgi:predicted acylesterase/phospholipase RssA
MIEAIATESSEGRLLLVATTDFASGEPVLWNLTSIAAHGGREAKALFRSILLASAGVPGMFPPVTITFRANGKAHAEIHVDGGVKMPFFVEPAPQDLPSPRADGTPRRPCGW